MKIDDNKSFSLDAGKKTWQVAKNMRRAWFVLFSGHSILPIWIVKKNPSYAFGPKESKNEVKNAFDALPEPENEPIYFHLRSSTIS